jgi:glycosyltransferase involved in cell wall biosynthesis
MKVDVVIPSKTGMVHPQLLHTLQQVSWVHNVIYTRVSPVNKARQQAVAVASTEWVAMIDDDITIPVDWFRHFESMLTDDVGAVSSVAHQTSPAEAAYTRMVKCFRRLDHVDTVPYSNNMVIRRSLMTNGYRAHPTFYGEDQYMRRHVENAGYRWVVLPYHGVTHHGHSHHLVESGMVFGEGRFYSRWQLLRRCVARFILIPYAAFSCLSWHVFASLLHDHVQFLAGWVKNMVKT